MNTFFAVPFFECAITNARITLNCELKAVDMGNIYDGSVGPLCFELQLEQHRNRKYTWFVHCIHCIDQWKRWKGFVGALGQA